jgi:hypothetical protein
MASVRFIDPVQHDPDRQSCKQMRAALDPAPLGDGSFCGKIWTVVIEPDITRMSHPRNRGSGAASSPSGAEGSVMSRLGRMAGFGPWRFGEWLSGRKRSGAFLSRSRINPAGPIMEVTPRTA